MSQSLGDILNDLYSQVMDSIDGERCFLCVDYLRSTHQKLLFAKKRLRSLKKQITQYKRECKIEVHGTYRHTSYPDMLPVEMDFDHCVTSLRSSLESLGQLINAVIPLSLPSKRVSGQAKYVSLRNVIKEIEDNESYKNDPYLSILSSYLQTVMMLTWYNELHDLRIDSFHIGFGKLPRTEILTLDSQLIEQLFLLPQGTICSAKTEGERNIVCYCERRVKDIERVLKKSFGLLTKYLSAR